MKFIYQCLLLLVCAAVLTAKPALSHAQIDQTDLSWLDSSLLDEIRNGRLVVVRDLDETDANDYKSPVTQRVLHIWWSGNSNSWQYKIVDYYVAEPIEQAPKPDAPANEITFSGEPTPMPQIEPNPELEEPVPEELVPQDEPTMPEEPNVPEEPQLTTENEPEITTATWTDTETATNTATATATDTATGTGEFTATATATDTETATNTATMTATDTATNTILGLTPTSTGTATATNTATGTLTDTATGTGAATTTATDTDTLTETDTATGTQEPTPNPLLRTENEPEITTATWTDTETATNTATATATDTATGTGEFTATATATDTETATNTATMTATDTATNTILGLTPTSTGTETATNTATGTLTDTATGTGAATTTATDTDTLTETDTATGTQEPTPEGFGIVARTQIHHCDEIENEIVSPATEDDEEAECSFTPSLTYSNRTYILQYVVTRVIQRDGKDYVLCKAVRRKVDYQIANLSPISEWKKLNKGNIKAVLGEFTHQNSPSHKDYSGFNKIALTDGQEHSSHFNYWEASAEDMERAVSKIVTTFPIIFDQSETKQVADELAKKEQGWKYAVIDCSDLDSTEDNVVRVHAAVLVAGYSEQDQKYQLFAWTGSKRAVLKDENADDAQKAVVREVLQKWLFSNVGKLVTCQGSPVREMKIWEDNLNFVTMESHLAFNQNIVGVNELSAKSMRASEHV